MLIRRLHERWRARRWVRRNMSPACRRSEHRRCLRRDCLCWCQHTWLNGASSPRDDAGLHAFYYGPGGYRPT